VPVNTEILIHKELTPLQLQWLGQRWQEGRNVVVILGTPIGSWIYESGYWEHQPIDRKLLLEAGRDKKNVADYIAARTMLSEPDTTAG
jgi:hypothetical protein